MNNLPFSFTDRPFTIKPPIINEGIPLYATAYENERKKQARGRQFMFGLRNKENRYDFDAEVGRQLFCSLKTHIVFYLKVGTFYYFSSTLMNMLTPLTKIISINLGHQVGNLILLFWPWFLVLQICFDFHMHAI